MDNNDLIRRSDVLSLTTKRNNVWDIVTDASGRGLTEIVDSIPAVDAVEVRHGRWQDPNGRQTEQERFNWTCSECGHFQHVPIERGWKEFGIQNKFCAYCGARMDGRREDGDA